MNRQQHEQQQQQQQRLNSLLEQLTLPDTDKIKHATKELQSLSLTNEFLLNLFHILRSEHNEQIRILASTLLRRKLKSSLSTVSLEIRQTLKQLLLEHVQHEQNERIKKSLFELIGTIAEEDLNVKKKKKHTQTSKWDELLQLAGTLVQSSDIKQVELGLCLFATLALFCGEFLCQHWPGVFNLVTNMLKNRSSTVICEQSLIILTNLVKHLHQKQHVQTVIDLVPVATDTIQYLFTTLKKENATNLFDLYEALLDCELPVIGPHLINIMNLCLQIAGSNDVLESVRYNSLHLLAEICRQKKKTLLKHEHLFAPIINTLLKIMCSTQMDSLTEYNNIDEQDDNEPVVVSGANHVLEAMSYNLPADKFVPIVISQVEPMLKSSEPNERKSAYYVLSGIIDGCCDYINNNYLEPYMTALKVGLEDVSQEVSSAALLALGETFSVMEGEITKHCQTLLPILMKLMLKQENIDKHNLKVIRIYYAVEELVGILDEEHETSLVELMQVLFHVYSITKNQKIKELVLSVYPSIGVVFKQKFVPYFDVVLQQLIPNLNQKPTDETMSMFSSSLNTLASLCRSVGTDHCKALIFQALDFSLNLFHEIDEPEFRAAVFSLCGAASHLLKSDLNSAYVSKIIKFLLESIKSTEWIEDSSKTEKRQLEWDVELEEVDIDNGTTNGVGDSDNDDDDDDDDDERLSVENVAVEEKASAIEALGDLAENCPIAFWPYLNESCQEVKSMIDFPNIHCSQNAMMAIGQIICSVHKMILSHDEKKILEDKLDELLNEYIPCLCITVDTTRSRTLAQVALDTIKTIFEELKAYMLKHEGLLEKAARCTQNVLSYKTTCQKEDNDEDESDGKNDAEYDAMLIETGGDLLPAITAIACQGKLPFFPQYLATVIPKLQRRLKQHSAVSERSFVIGVLAETVQNMTEDVVRPYIQSLYHMFYEYLPDQDSEVRTNSVFGMGVLCLTAKQQLFPQYETILNRLSSLLINEKNLRAIDNICSCLCRMMLVSTSHVPLNAVLPVLFQYLPIREDYAEVGSIFLCLTLLYQQHFNQIELYLPKSIEMAANVIDDSRLNSDTVQVVREYLRAIHLSHTAAFVQVVNHLDENLKGKLSKH
ncbi:unnamed protein product, partial [Didymodactylos carnosus]